MHEKPPGSAGGWHPNDPYAIMTNPAGGAIVNAVGPVRQLLRGEDTSQRRYLVIAPGTADEHGAPAQIQMQ